MRNRRELGRLIAQHELDRAARASVAIAACAHAAREAARAEEVLRRAYVMELDVTAAIAHTRADFQQFAERVRVSVAASPRRRVEIATQPAGATVTIDGRSARCGPASCVATVIAGEHIVVAERFGRRERIASINEPLGPRVVLALDPAPPPEARSQVAAAMFGPVVSAPPPTELGALAADAFGAAVVVLVRSGRGTSSATITIEPQIASSLRSPRRALMPPLKPSRKRSASGAPGSSPLRSPAVRRSGSPSEALSPPAPPPSTCLRATRVMISSSNKSAWTQQTAGLGAR